MSTRTIVIAFISIVIVVISGVLYHNSLNDLEKEAYLKALSFKFSGVITGKKELYSSTGLIYVDMKASTVSHYTQRSQNGYYYCILKDDKAEIIETMDLAEIGDSIVVDGFNHLVTIYGEDGKKKEKKIWVSDFDLFYRQIKKHHKLHR